MKEELFIMELSPNSSYVRIVRFCAESDQNYNVGASSGYGEQPPVRPSQRGLTFIAVIMKETR